MLSIKTKQPAIFASFSPTPIPFPILCPNPPAYQGLALQAERTWEHGEVHRAPRFQIISAIEFGTFLHQAPMWKKDRKDT